MMYEVFGAMFYSDGIYSSYMDYDSNVSAGDWVRIDLYGGYTSGTHSIFITKVTDKGVYYTDGNGTGVYNQIRWDGYYTWAEFNSMFRWRVHLPGNNLKGQDTVYTVAYNGNGGSGSMSSETLAANGKFKLKSNGFKRSGYTFGGYTVRRSSDGKWYTTDAGWQTQSEIYDNEYTYKVYPQGNSYTLGTPWIGGINSSCTFTFYAQWIPDKSTVEFFDNYSGYNYILGSDLSSDYSDYIYSRDTSVYSVSVDSSERLNNADSLKIVGKSAGEMGSDLAIGTSTGLGWGNGYSQLCDVGDDQDYYLRFCAKSSVEGAKMYIRWGFSSSFESVTLTKSWKIYTVLLPKNRFYGAALHPYFDKKGTYYLNSLAMGIGRTTNVTPESGSYAADPVTVTRGSTLTSMPTPARSGYSFVGWFTEAEGGEQVTKSTPVNTVSLRLYAHWVKDVSYTPVKTLVSNGHLYELYDNQMGWEDAEEFCEELGGHLITVDSNYENTVAYDMISDRQGYCWIGLNYNILTDSWEWASGDWYIFNRWYKPSYGTEYSGEHYAMMYPMNIGTTAYAGTWDKCVGSSARNSYYCYYNSFFICEYDSTATLGDADGSGDVDITDASVVQHKLI
ncbi:MAG: InlB B-repeat-containing protein, partial [Ruminococcus sp.]|nr:InlB B-repeat-containing protein [Ruminococcus sp.]